VCASWMTAPRVENPAVEPGIEMNLATPKELMALILAEEFVLQLHVGALLLPACADTWTSHRFDRT
jgi:hypothetical protein